KEHLFFTNYIATVEKLFTKKPIILFYDDLRKDPMGFFDYIAKQIGVKYNKDKVDLSSKHKSYSEKQLKALAKVGKRINLRKETRHKAFYQLRRFYTNMIRYSTLYIAALLPDRWFNDEPLIKPEELNAVKEYYAEDWQTVIEYAKKNNPE
ncbi:MAG: hypothetical protein GXO47_11235, partial [Chlorobi bacterium]|nr:hypothetical protein [Chlorobiota bacterium]